MKRMAIFIIIMTALAVFCPLRAGALPSTLSPDDWRLVYIGPGHRVSIDLDSTARPAIASCGGAGGSCARLDYFYWDGSGWQADAIDMFEGTRIYWSISLGLGSGDVPYVAYDLDAIGRHPVAYSTKEGGVWRSNYVDYNWGDWGVSLAMDGSGQRHIVYKNNTTGILYHNGEAIGNFPSYAGLAVDDAGSPHVLHRGSGSVVAYSHKVDGVWTTETVETAGGTSHRSIAWDGAGLQMVYGRRDAGTGIYQLRYAVGTAGSGFAIETIAESSSEGFKDPSIAVDGGGIPHIIYYNGGELRYATHDGGRWQTEVVTEYTSPVGYQFGIAVTADGIPHIVYARDGYIRYVTPYRGETYNNPPVGYGIEAPLCRSGNIADLSIECDGAKEMMLSENPDFEGAGWESCWRFRPFTVSESWLPPDYDDQIVYAKFRGDDPALESDVVSATSVHCGPGAIIETNSHIAMFGEDVRLAGRGRVYDGEIVAYEWRLDGVVVGSSPEVLLDSPPIGVHTIEFRVQAGDGRWSPSASDRLIIASGDIQPSRIDDVYQYIYERMDLYEDDLAVPRLIESYATPYAPFTSGDAFVYDNALAVGALLARRQTEDVQRARLILAKLIELNLRDAPLRESYRASTSSMTRGSVYTGNLAWTIIALMQYYKYSGDTDAVFLEQVKAAAINMGERIEGRCRDGEPGYKMYAYDAKSTEHNIDLYVAFELIASELEGAEAGVWRERARWAWRFVESMWAGNSYGTGNTTGVRVEDVNSWAILANAGGVPDAGAVLRWLESNCATLDGGFVGFDFDTDRDGVWFEGTAHTALAYQVAGDMRSSEVLVNELRRAQIGAENTNGRSIVAASNWGLSTNLGWEYFSSPHIGATAWYLAAEQQYNMFWGVPTVDADGDGVPDTIDACPLDPNDPIGDPCNHNDCADFSLEDGVGNACIHNDCSDRSLQDSVGNPCDHNDCSDRTPQDGVGDNCNHNDCSDRSLQDSTGDPCVHNDCPDFSMQDSIGNTCNHDEDGDGDPDLSDCAPLDFAVHHGATEVCNIIDDDCDTLTDEELGQSTCGLGVCGHTIDNCGGGGVPQICDPMEGAGSETCDGEDNDCNGEIDEEFDSDRDGIADCFDDDIDLRPDLVIEGARVVSVSGRRVRMLVTVVNRGGSAVVGRFHIGGRPNWYTKPGFNDVYLFSSLSGGLPAGESLQRIFYMPRAESWELTIDSGNRIDEANEDNNMRVVVRE